MGVDVGSRKVVEPYSAKSHFSVYCDCFLFCLLY